MTYLRVMGVVLVCAGVWLAIETGFDIHRSGRLIFYHFIHLLNAGSTFALGLVFALGLL